MKAYQVVEFGAPLVSRHVPDPTADARAVVVEVTNCGLCHSDVHLQQGHIGLGGIGWFNPAASHVKLAARAIGGRSNQLPQQKQYDGR